MAEINTSGLDELLVDMGAIAEIPDAVLLEMLVAEAEVIAPAQAQEARAMGVYDTGTTAQSITYDKKLKDTKDGKAGQPGRPFINTANEKKADSAVDAAAGVYDRFLKSKNL